MSFLAAVKAFSCFFFKVADSWGPGLFLTVFSVLFNSGSRHSVYLVGIALFGFTLKGFMLLAPVFGVSALKIVVQSRREVDECHLYSGELLNGHRIIDTWLESFIQTCHACPLVLGYLGRVSRKPR
jgi:hypothetical protein